MGPALESDMAGVLKFSDQELKTTMINIKALRDKVYSIQEQRGNVTEMEILRKNQKGMLELRNTDRNKGCLGWAC